jgi:putative oxidoreductase
MDRISHYSIVVARVLISIVFILNGFGIIDQTIPAKELMERGAPASLVPLMMLAGRMLELAAGFALALGIVPRLAALALVAFLVPATLVSHSFWLAAGTPAFQGQLINFSKNIAMWGGLLFIAGSAGQPSLLAQRKLRFAIHEGEKLGEAGIARIDGVQ